MERDFFGMNSKDSFAVVKEEVKDECKDSAFMRGSGMQCSFSNKVSALPQFMSFKAVQEDRLKKTLFDSAFDANNKPAASIAQKNFNLNRQGGTNYAITGYPLQHVDAHSAHRPHEVRMLPVSNQNMYPFFKTHVGSAGQSLSATTVKQQPLGGIPVTAPHSILPTADSMAGINNPKNMFKPSETPSQLTIFYAGAVNVYDDMSPEKAQAIMFLAGNGSLMTANTANAIAQGQGSTPKMVMGDAVHGNQCHSTSPPYSGVSSPLSVTSHTGSQSRSGSSSTDELVTAKPMPAPISQPEPPKIVTSLGSTTATLMPLAVPQARNASLARFLEKRKERVMNTAPYNLSKKSPDSGTPESKGVSGNSVGTAVPLPVSKEQSWCMGN